MHLTKDAVVAEEPVEDVVLSRCIEPAEDVVQDGNFSTSIDGAGQGLEQCIDVSTTRQKAWTKERGRGSLTMRVF